MSRGSRAGLLALVVAGLTVGAEALAEEERVVVVPPVVGAASDLTTALESAQFDALAHSSELSQVRRLPGPLPQRTPACLERVPCLEKLAITGRASHLVGIPIPDARLRAEPAAKPEKPPKPDRVAKDRVGWRLAARGGWARYDKFDFGSAGLEVGRRLFGPVFVIAGAEAYLVNRELPPNLETVDGETRVWDAMVPVHAGLQVQTLTGTWRPYVGADVVTAPYLRDDAGQHWTQGARGRLGFDAMLGSVAWTVHTGLGVWSDDAWTRVEPDIATAGPVLQVGTGLVFTR